MTDKQILFCEEYLKDFNATQAAMRAGYSPQSAYSIGHENLKKPEIQDYINERKAEVSNASNLTLYSLIADLNFIKNKCAYEKFDPTNAIRACELLSKFLVQNEIKQREYIKNLPTEELEKLARRLLDK